MTMRRFLARTALLAVSALVAQRYANQGWFVLATYKNHREDLPGHMAIVPPSEKDARRIAVEES